MELELLVLELGDEVDLLGDLILQGGLLSHHLGDGVVLADIQTRTLVDNL